MPAPAGAEDARRVFVKTWGCQMNVYDSGRMVDALRPLGFNRAEAAEEADLVILNTCHIREKATEKLFSELGRLAQLKRARAAAGRPLKIAVAGCVAQAEGALVADRQPAVDLIVGPQALHRLPELLAAVEKQGGQRRAINTDFPEESKFDLLPETTTAPGPVAMLAIQEGCDKFCTFCVVPYTRGAELSRPAAAILEEARRLLDLGARELVLLGQNVNAYAGPAPEGGARGVSGGGPGSGETWSLARLLRALAEDPRCQRLRFTTSHPRDMGADLIAAFADLPQLMPFLHLPVQAGDDRILAAMNRGHTADDYRRLIDRLRAVRADLALSSDFIVGFPGETRAAFDKTLALVRDVGFTQAYSFRYSARPGTPAANMAGQVPETARAERLAELQALLATQQNDFNRGFLGRTVPVLFDRPGARPGQLAGRTPWHQAVHAVAPARLLGHIQDVTITAAHTVSLAGQLALVDPDQGQDRAA